MKANTRSGADSSNQSHSTRNLSRKLFALAAAAVSTALGAGPVAADHGGHGLAVVGLTADQRLVWFRSDNPRRLFEIGSVTGLNSADTSLIGIDYRVQDGRLYAVGSAGGIYTIDTKTAVATNVSNLTVKLEGDSFGVDFNPAANALRVVSNAGQNLRHPFAGPVPGPTVMDDPLDYPPPSPTNTSGLKALGIAGAAYTNNDLSADTATTLFDLDTMLDQVAIQAPPNNGSLAATGKLTVDADPAAGFDIYTTLKKGVAVANAGFASLSVAGDYGFYSVKLTTGKAVKLGRFKEQIVDIAIPLRQ
jgi:hypothetical protein